MKKQIVTIVLGAVIMLGTATTLFAQNGLPTGGYPPVMGGAGGNPAVPGPAYGLAAAGPSYLGSGTAYHHTIKHHKKLYMSAKHQRNGY
jgi:hypothetical protein